MTTTEDLYQQAFEAYDKHSRILTTSEYVGLRAVVDLVLAARPEMTDAEVLRKARELTRNYLSDRPLSVLTDEAIRLEAEYRAEQEKAAAEAEREKLIEQAARIQCDGWYGEAYFDSLPIGNKVRERYITDCGLLYDAGWRPAPESDGGAA